MTVNEQGVPEANPGPASPDTDGATWPKVVGAIALGLGVLTLIGLIFAAILGYPVPCGQRWLVGSLLGLLLALGFAFLGGEAMVEGPLPTGSASPLAISIGGGVAVFLVVLLVFRLAVPGCSGPAVKLAIDTLHATSVPSGTKVDMRFRAVGVRSDQKVRVVVSGTDGETLLADELNCFGVAGT